jgi:hypothetical protein
MASSNLAPPVCSSHEGYPDRNVSGNATSSTCWAAAFSSQAMTFFVVADGSSQYGRAWAAAMRIVRFPFQTEAAKTSASCAKALNSSALPAGSVRNIVHCSPGCPAKRR